MILKGKTALVTGGGRGIGRAIALLLAEEGAHVTVCSRTRAELDGTVSLIRKDGGHAHAEACDLTDEPSVTALFEGVARRNGGLDILVNNAGIFSGGPVENVSLNELRRVMAVNAEAVFLCCREAFKLMKKGGGSIVTVSSLSGVQGAKKFPGFSAYCASKFAVIGIAQTLAEEGREYGIRSNVVAPGAVDTEMLKKSFPGFGGPLLKPEQVARTVLFLAGPQSDGVSGATIEMESDLQKP